MSNRTGLFGGTFDPVHNGHVSIALSFLSSGHIDELWVLLTPHPPHKTDFSQTEYTIRYHMAAAAFEHLEQVRVLTVENELPTPSYTIQTIRHLKKLHPDHDFSLCMGEDSLAQFHQWKEYESILEECGLLVARRPGISSDGIDEQILQEAHFVPHEPIPISSTAIREQIRSGESVTEYLPDKVLNIIEKEHLYR